MEYFFNNILEDGSIMASPCEEPNYRFHWVRDAAIVIKSVITLYKRSQNSKYMEILENYIQTELEHIKHHPAEPKFELDKSPYTGDWGRPQNDGPAMRGIVCLKLLKIMGPKYSNSLLKIINSDLSYTIEEIDQPCFDLWEEQFGYHLYTRMLQTKFIYDAFKCNRVKKNEERLTAETLTRVRTYLSHHISDNGIYSSYDTHGQVQRQYDASVLLGLAHVDYDLPILKPDDPRIAEYASVLLAECNEIYPLNNKTGIPFLGRYKEDKYFNGNPWIITTIALYHYWNKTNRPLNGFIEFLQFIKDKNMDLHEQMERTSGEGVSVNRLTWNYAELITLMSNIQFGSLFLL
jgi:glucoamylase